MDENENNNFFNSSFHALLDMLMCRFGWLKLREDDDDDSTIGKRCSSRVYESTTLAHANELLASSEQLTRCDVKDFQLHSAAVKSRER